MKIKCIYGVCKCKILMAYLNMHGISQEAIGVFQKAKLFEYHRNYNFDMYLKPAEKNSEIFKYFTV